jgi:hypothetical protein
MIGVAGLLGWLVVHTDVFFADGLRYIAQAKAIDGGSWSQGLVRSVDHPVYPMAIAVIHRIMIPGDDPESWQLAGQTAAAIAGVLLVVPLYLIGIELVGPAAAWIAVFLVFLIPFNGHVLADTLSESSFLLVWCWGIWATLRFLRGGQLRWLNLIIACAVLAYLTRPEGLILPVALLITLASLSVTGCPELPAAKRWAAIAILVIGPLALAGPFMIIKGGVSTKPSMLRILGIGRPAPAMAVERERPLEPGQTAAKTTVLATRAMLRAVEGATTLPLLLLAPLGVLTVLRSPTARRQWVFLGTIVGLSMLAMIRLHAMSGYCTPRHAMVVSWILIPAGALGLHRVALAIERWARSRFVREGSRLPLAGAIMCAAIGTAVVLAGPAALAPIDPGFHGYRLAGEWLSAIAGPGEGMVDPKGFSLFYAGRQGYTFASLGQAAQDQNVRWVVAHEALIFGPWDYSKSIRAIVADRQPVRVFPAKPQRRVSKVYVYDLTQPDHRAAAASAPDVPARR